MTKEEYLEYWNSMSHAELVVRAGLYIDRIAELEAQVVQLQAGVSEMENEMDQEAALMDEASDHIAELEAKVKRLREQGERREAELIRQVDCVIDLQAQLRAVQAVIDAAKTAVDFQPEEGSETDYATARRLWAELVIAVRKAQTAE